MSKIHDAVAQVRRLPSVRGVVVLTNDGLVAATALEADQSSQVIAGLASYLLMTTNRSLGEGELGKCSQLVVHATNGKAVLVDLGDSFLVVLFDQFAEIGPAQEGIDDAAAQIRAASQLS